MILEFVKNIVLSVQTIQFGQKIKINLNEINTICYELARN